MSNYDATNGAPFTRVIDVSVTYPPSGSATVTYHTQQALLDKSGAMYMLANTIQQSTMTIDPTDTTALQVYDPANGQPIAGQTVTAAQILLSIYAAIHNNQLANDK